MADCSYARCLQERRSIKRELQRWTKNMVYVVGLERVAEELMGRRKWKLYQDVQIARNLPLSQDPLAPSSDTQEPQSEEEDRPMIATAETLQRNSSASDLNSPLDSANNRQDNAIQQHQDKTKDQDLNSPIQLDEDSKDNEKEEVERNSTTRDDTTPQKDDTSATVTAGLHSILKIKTIEEINTVSSEAGVSESTGCGPTETILESLIKRSSSGPPRKQQPADWTPQDKCYFCVDGELVRPGANAQEAAPPPQQQPSPVESESESSSSRSAPSPPRSSQFLLNSQAQAQALAHFLQLQQGGAHPTMEQMQSIAASLAAVAAFRGGAPLAAPINSPMQPSLQPALQPAMLPAWYMAAAQQQRAVATPDRCSSGADKGASSPGTSPSGEQPLDLSSKGGGGGGSVKVDSAISMGGQPQSALEARLAGLRMPTMDHKQIFNRAKPRLAAAGGRRAYSEAELQMALRDIQSGKLGTRRAAVIYNIPRSTLRNKVYKMASEKEREARLPGIGQHSAVADRAEDSNDIADDDNDSVIDEDKDEERDISRPLLSMDDVLRYSQIENSSYGTSENLRALLQKGGQKFFDMESPKRDNASDLWPGMEHGAMGSYIQSLLLAGGLSAPMPKPDENHTMPMMPEIMRLLEERNNILKEQLMKKEHMNNGKPLDLLEDDPMNKRIFSRQSSSASSVITRNDRTTPGRKTDSPDDVAMEITEHGESRESPSNVILKIPSFKPLVTGPNSGKNGGESFQDPATPPLPYFSHSPHSEVNLASRSLSPNHEHSKGMFSLRQVIAKSINEKFLQGAPVNHTNDINRMKMGSPGVDAMESLNVFKRGRLTPPMGGQGISVIKNLAGHDLSRSFVSNSGSQNQQNNSAGGKGTRPKRGKYRNYDRDSLVEAVKAVQRGEMSVHRAGSFYGVPHSTLEYKVKERHLMRPRKREPKNPAIEEQKSSMASGSKPPDSTNRIDKPKQPQKPMSKPPNFPSSSPNGLKMPPIFDGNLPLGYNPSPFPFWPHAPPFHGLPVDFAPRNPGTSAGFSPNPESFFASQMMQRLQEESARHPGQSQKVSNPLTTNGSFLEGIIRSSLEQPVQRGRSSLEDQSGSDEGEAGRRRLRPDDLLLAEEMREAARRVRAREAASTNAAASNQQPPPHPS